MLRMRTICPWGRTRRQRAMLELDETERLFEAMCMRLDFLDKVELHRGIDGGWIN